MNRLQAELNIQKQRVQLRILAVNLSITEKEGQLETIENEIEKDRFEMERLIGYRNGLDATLGRISEIMTNDIAAAERLREALATTGGNCEADKV